MIRKPLTDRIAVHRPVLGPVLAPVLGPVLAPVLGAALLLVVAAATAVAQDPPEGPATVEVVTGRILDLDTRRPVADAVVELVDLDRRAVTSEDGLFQFADVPAGRHGLRIQHIAYGERTEWVLLEGARSVAVRIDISQEAIFLDPVVVATLSGDERAARARGTAIHEVTAEEIERASRTAHHLGDVLRQTIPAIQVQDAHLVPGIRICVRFRGQNSVAALSGCRTPTVFLDGVQMFEPSFMLTTLEPGELHRIELIPPGEAGVLYGTGTQAGSNAGVLVIETKVWADRQGDEQIVPRALLGAGTYNWFLERGGHPWKQAFGGAALGNAVGLAAGLTLANQCLSLDDLAYNIGASRCGDWATAGVWAAAVVLPALGAGLGTRFTGDTPVSRGHLLPAVLASTMILIPGYALATTSTVDDFSAGRVAGSLFIAVGVPAAATIADHLFRSLKGDPRQER